MWQVSQSCVFHSFSLLRLSWYRAGPRVQSASEQDLHSSVIVKIEKMYEKCDVHLASSPGLFCLERALV